MKPPKSKMAELAHNATGGEKSHAETAESAEFKMTELGPIPVDWEVKRLGDVSSLITKGTTPTSVGCDFECYGINFIKAESISDNGDFIPEKFAHIDEHTDMLLSRSKLKKGDFLFSIAGVLGRVALVTDEVLPANTNQALAVIRLGSNNIIDKRYLFFALKSEYLRSRVKEENVAAAQANLSLQDVNDFHVALPPLAEQRRIAGALSDIDELISALGKLIEKKRNIKTGTMQELLGMRNEECGMRNVPRRRLAGFSGAWVEKRFDECFEIIGNNTYARECMCDDCGGVANIHYGDVLIRYGSVLDCSRTAVPSLINSIICRTDRLSDGDVIIADTAEDETVGKAIEIRGIEGRCAVSGLHTIACRPRFDFAPGWLGYYINSSTFHDQLLPLITGTKVSSISKAGLRTTILNVPTIAEQRAIATVLSDMDAEIAALEAKRTKYESIKQGMMQELLTGKTRLKP